MILQNPLLTSWVSEIVTFDLITGYIWVTFLTPLNTPPTTELRHELCHTIGLPTILPQKGVHLLHAGLGQTCTRQSACTHWLQYLHVQRCLNMRDLLKVRIGA